ncbi:MAG: zinc-dependent metalloprotease [Nocardioidaceae bacterium]|nr:zinc-dependent metalloprotease [Nocardioidaceae bacterium]MDQ3325718.1 zinc-dependent metalloprotease [Actinomycetota bacterium]
MATDPPPNDGEDETPDPSGPVNPLEHLMGALGGGAPGAGPFGSGGAGGLDLAALFGQMQQWLSPHDGPVNWNLAGQTARQVVAQHSDPSPGANQTSAVRDAVRLADLWLDGATDMPSGVAVSVAWSRAEWVEQTRPVWATVVEPVAEHVVAAMGQAMPAEVKQMAGPLAGLLGQAGGAMFGHQLGQALGALAGEVLSGSDVGLPLAPAGTAAILPANVAAFGDGLGQEPRDVLLYVALRECAHQRLFVHVPWLRSHLLGAVEAYARGTRLDLSAIEETVRGIDPTDPAALQAALSDGMFEPTKTPEQVAALTRLETLLALVEGWVDEVVAQATNDRMPSAAALREAVRRRRASGGPAEQTFASLVGLELRPRRLRDAATLWSALRDREGATARDQVWSHPDLLPSAADLDDPLGFAQGERAEATTGGGAVSPTSDADFDAALRDLLDDPDNGPEGPSQNTSG